ncbi:hypothetical protein ACH5RR_028763 [Cinchona calisaya]|uniref:Uncharacterized protein n=1 Tax=Cinchona calisaya TaxID=153742 RepID=A0ABD2YT11_9GENT
MGDLPTTLKTLKCDGCGSNFKLLLENDSSHGGSLVERLTLWSCDSLKVVPLGSFPMLKSIYIADCKSIEMLYIPPHGIQSSSLTSLQSLFIVGCNDLMSFPEGGLPAPNLIEFHLWDCEKLKLLPE